MSPRSRWQGQQPGKFTQSRFSASHKGLFAMINPCRLRDHRGRWVRTAGTGGRLTGRVSTMRSVIESLPQQPGGSFIRKPGLRLHCQGAHSAQIGAPVDLAIAGPTDRPPGAVSGLLVGLLAVLGGVCRMGESPIYPGGMVVEVVLPSACR